ncbi:hypothetical protein ElyMa_004033000 [Elysia marginata]|uniref:Uncharacterized protein n=1 Tax=Elysia marginata TaxID=1093978 RepID=A0AAV4G303_9GAST|nr:hypothetical protein ElyMa_004033000 [Elysia marginata]
MIPEDVYLAMELTNKRRLPSIEGERDTGTEKNQPIDCGCIGVSSTEHGETRTKPGWGCGGEPVQHDRPWRANRTKEEPTINF